MAPHPTSHADAPHGSARRRRAGPAGRRLAAWSLAGLLALGAAQGCASRAPTPHPFPTPSPPPAPDAPAGEAVTSHPAALAIVDLALSLRGTPYRAGGSDRRGFDCSGFVQYVYGHQGLALPRTVFAQASAGAAVASDDLRPGDLMFFATEARGPTHVGIALGGGRFVHAPNRRGVVRIESLESRYWDRRYLGARRVLAEP